MKHKHFREIIPEARVIEDEVQLLVRRRENAFEREEDSDTIKRSRVGLSLSGGGVRSGALCLGFLQGLIERKVLPFVDYLSTVSGGGYAGSFLSSYAVKDDDSDQLNCVGNDQVSNFGTQPKRILRLIYSVDYLRHFGSFLNRSVFGSLLIFVVFLSGLILLTSSIAAIYQLVNERSVRYFIGALGFNSDILAAFFPTTVLALCWIFLWFCSYLRHGKQADGKIARPFLFATFVSFLVALAMLLGTGDISMERIPGWLGYEVEGIQPQQWTQPLVAAFAGMILASLLPYFRPQLLIKSGLNPRSSAFERASFWVATRGLVVGVPLLMVGLFAREDISGKNAQRNAEFKVRNEVLGWKKWDSETKFLDELKHDPLLRQAIWNAPLSASAVKIGSSSAAIVQIGSSSAAIAVAPYQPKLSPEDIAQLSEIIDFSESELQRMTAGEIIEELQEALREESGKIDALALSVPNAWANMIAIPFDSWLRTRQPTPQSNPRLTESWRKQEESLSSNPLLELIGRRERVYKLKSAILVPINVRLRSPGFFAAFQSSSANATAANSAATAASGLLRTPIGTVDSEPFQAAVRAGQIYLAGTPQAQQRRDALVAANRNLLESYVPPDLLNSPKAVFANFVWQADQKYRLSIILWSAVVFLVSGFCIDLNVSSIHRYYSRRLAEAWIEPKAGVDQSIPLTLLDTVSKGYPYHLLTGSAYFPGRRNQDDYPEPFDYFLFSQQYCGSERTQFAETKEFMGGKYALDDAMAISGAAVSILHLTKNPLLTTILFVLNFRLGQWIDNPGHRTLLPQWLGRAIRDFAPISPLRVLFSMASPAEERDLCFVADGGFFDNLGVDSLLRRRCKVILAVDAGADANSQFDDLMRLSRYARMKHGIEFTGIDGSKLDLDQLRRSEEGVSLKHHLAAKIHYPDGSIGLMIYVKSSMTMDESDELIQYFRSNPDFPHDSTADQAFLPGKFESYRMLGQHIANMVVQELSLDADFGSVEALVDTLFNQLGVEREATDDRLVLEKLLEDLSSDEVDKRSLAIRKLECFVPQSSSDVRTLMAFAVSDSPNQSRTSYDRARLCWQVLQNNSQVTLRLIPEVLNSIESNELLAAVKCVGWLAESEEEIPEVVQLKLVDLAGKSSHTQTVRLAIVRMLNRHRTKFICDVETFLEELADGGDSPRLSRAARKKA